MFEAIKYDPVKEERYQQEAKQKELQRIEETLQLVARRGELPMSSPNIGNVVFLRSLPPIRTPNHLFLSLTNVCVCFVLHLMDGRLSGWRVCI